MIAKRQLWNEEHWAQVSLLTSQSSREEEEKTGEPLKTLIWPLHTAVLQYTFSIWPSKAWMTRQLSFCVLKPWSSSHLRNYPHWLWSMWLICKHALRLVLHVKSVRAGRGYRVAHFFAFSLSRGTQEICPEALIFLSFTWFRLQTQGSAVPKSEL